MFYVNISAAEIVKAIEESKDMQSLRLEGNTVGVEAAEAIAKALQKRPEFEVIFNLTNLFKLIKICYK